MSRNKFLAGMESNLLGKQFRIQKIRRVLNEGKYIDAQANEKLVDLR